MRDESAETSCLNAELQFFLFGSKHCNFQSDYSGWRGFTQPLLTAFGYLDSFACGNTLFLQRTQFSLTKILFIMLRTL